MHFRGQLDVCYVVVIRRIEWVVNSDRLVLQVIDKNPSVGRVVSNFRNEDYQKIAATTIVSLPFGYLAGENVSHLRRPFVERC